MLFETSCRTNQINFLISILKNSEECCLPNLFVYGHTSMGKTSTLIYVMEKLQIKFSHINCIDSYSPRLIFESIIQQMDSNFNLKCLNTNQFLYHLKTVFCTMGLKHYYILFEKSEKLRENSLLLSTFLRLNELSNLNLGVIFESEIIWEKFRSGSGFKEPLIYHFSDYSKDDLCKILMHFGPNDCPKDFYSNFLQLLVNFYFYACRDLKELRYLASISYPVYIEPITIGEATFEDTHKLWKKIEPFLKNSLKSVYLRTLSSSNLTTAKSLPVTKTNIELPVYTKFILIAAYIASYNPAITDRRFFSKNSGKLNKRKLDFAKNKQERINCHLLGPKYFPLDRLMAIFYSIVEDKIPPSSNTFLQITSLVSLGLLSQSSSSDLLESPKYKCLVSLEFIQSISKSVDFEVLRYLFDFV